MAERNLATAYVQIKPTTKGISGDLSKAIGGEASSAGDKAGGLLGAGIISKLGTVIAAAGIGEMIRKSLDAGGALQQSFGGLETIYGEAADQAKEFAMQAAQAGISANSYAEQAVSFGASLKQAFGGDTTKAVEAANTAIMDMADNAAKMGTPLESIQAAYQGFAKQNYTLLDNLKIGYGGTKTEMERLLRDAQKITGVKYDINNLGDVYDAIHVIQGELGLTGVAAKEASETFTGSIGAMKANLENVLATLSTGGDVTAPLTSLLESVGNFLINNLVPMLANIVRAIPPALSTLLTTLAPQIGTLFTETFANLPQLLESGTEMVNSLVNGFIAGLPNFISTAISLVGTFVKTILSSLPSILSAGADILLNLVTGIMNNLPQITTSAFSAIIDFIAGIGEKLPDIIQQGFEILTNLATGIINAIPDLVAKIPEVIDGIKNKFAEYDWASIGKDIIDGIGNGLKNFASGLWESAGSLASGLTKKLAGAFKIGSPSKLMADEIGRWIPAGIAMGIEDNMDILDNALSDATNPIYTQTAYNPGESYSIGEDISRAIAGANENQNVNVNVTLVGDSAKLFKVVRTENNKFRTSKGQSAFNY